MFKLSIRTENDAFVANRDHEIARILRATATQLESGSITQGSSKTLFDANGNDVGRALIAWEEESVDLNTLRGL